MIEKIGNGRDAAEAASMQAPAEYTLTTIEKKFLLYAERGDCASVKQYKISSL